MNTFFKKNIASMRFWVLGLFLLLVSGCSSLFYYPDRMLYIEPKSMELEYQEVHFQSIDGTKLMGWYFPARLKKKTDRPRGTIVQFHGNATNISNHFLSLVWTVEEGYDLFTFDYRGYGRSEGEPNPKGTALDGISALQKALELQKKRSSPLLITVGQSLGGAILMRSLQESHQTVRPDLVVLDSTFVSYQTIGKRILARSWITWLFQPFSYLLLSDSYTGEDWLESFEGKLLVIHDRYDKVVPFSCGEDIINDSKTKEKEFWILDQGGHIAAFADPASPYRKKFIDSLSGLLPAK